MKKITLLLSLLFSITTFSQIKGTITDIKGKPIAFANIYIKDTYISTTSNEQGKYELNLKTEGTYVILFQYLGYKTEKKVVEVSKIAQNVDITLVEEEIHLEEVIIDKKVNPAIEIIKNAIANRKENAIKTAKFNADFYSRGIFRVKNLPKTIMGKKNDFFDEVIAPDWEAALFYSIRDKKILGLHQNTKFTTRY